MAKVARDNKRTPLTDGFRSRLKVQGKDPNYEYYIVNDTPGRVDDFKAAGWEPVTDDEVRIGENRVGLPTAEGSVKTVHVGGGQTGVLMKIKKEWWEEDQAAKRKRNIDLTKNQLSEAKQSSDFGDIKLS